MKIPLVAKKIFDRIIRFCAVLSTIAIVLIMLAVVLDVSLRWMKIPIYGVFELNGLLMGINIFLGLALTQADKKHISVTFFSQRLSDRRRHAITAFLFCLCFIFFAWISYQYAFRAYDALITGEIIQGYIPFPVFPLKAAMSLGVALLTIQLAIDVVAETKALFLNQHTKVQGP